MYTILDDVLDRQLLSPVTRKAPKETCVSAQPAAPAAERPFQPWKMPFLNEQEWQFFLERMLGALHDAPEEARAIFTSALRAVTEMVNLR